MAPRKRKKFSQIWASQTDIGNHFGLSAIAVGKILTAHGFRDPDTRLATTEALESGWCAATPLKTGVMHYMWNIDKVRKLLETEGVSRLSPEERLANDVIATIRAAEHEADEGNDKLGYLMLTGMFDGIPKSLRPAVAQVLVAKGFSEYVNIS